MKKLLVLGIGLFALPLTSYAETTVSQSQINAALQRMKHYGCDGGQKQLSALIQKCYDETDIKSHNSDQCILIDMAFTPVSINNNNNTIKAGKKLTARSDSNYFNMNAFQQRLEKYIPPKFSKDINDKQAFAYYQNGIKAVFTDFGKDVMSRCKNVKSNNTK